MIRLSILIFAIANPAAAQWRPTGLSTSTPAAISDNFKRAALWSNRKLDKFGNDTIYGLPKFNKGIKFSDGSTQTSSGAGLSSTQTFTGHNTFVSSMTLPANSKINLTDTLHTSSSGVISDGATSNSTSFAGCFSTRTITTMGNSNVWISFGGSIYSDAAAVTRMTVLVDGVSLTAFGVPFFSQASDPATVSYHTFGHNFPVYISAAGSHSVCIGLWTSGSIARIDTTISYPYFAIEEHR